MTRLTVEKREMFCQRLVETGGNVSAAARLINISRAALYKARGRDKKLTEMWDDAIEEGVDALEAEAFRRALHGIDDPVYFQGKQVGIIKRYSDTLLMFLLKGRRPETYRDRATLSHENLPMEINVITGISGAPASKLGDESDDD